MSRFPMRTFQQDAILKRLSDGLVAVETTDIKALTDSQLNKLQCGDIVVKKTGEQEHAYVVTYKQDKHGICLTYTDASCVETQSYDYDSVHKTWVYNSEDKSELPVNMEDASFKPIYCHPIYCSYTRSTDSDIVTFTCLIFNNDSNAFTKASFLEWILSFFNTYNDASIMASGYKATFPVSRLKKHPSTSQTLFALEVASSNGQANNYYSIGVDELTSATFTDGVNKIN